MVHKIGTPYAGKPHVRFDVALTPKWRLFSRMMCTAHDGVEHWLLVLVALVGGLAAHGGAIENVSIDGVSSPVVGDTLTAKASDEDGTSYEWKRGIVKKNTGVPTYDEVVSSTDRYTLSEADYETFIRVIASNSTSSATNWFYFSKLPVVYLSGEMPTEKAQDYKTVDLHIQGNGDVAGGYSGVTEIKVRGNSTANMPKKPMFCAFLS